MRRYSLSLTDYFGTTELLLSCYISVEGHEGRRMKPLILILTVLVAGCAVTYPVTIIDDTADMVVIRATGKTEYEAMHSATAKAESMLGQYTEVRPPDCNYNSGGQQGVGSWHECVVYAAK